MGVAAILFNGAGPFEQIGNTFLTEGTMWNLMKITKAVSEKTFKTCTILYVYSPDGKVDNPQGQHFYCPRFSKKKKTGILLYPHARSSGRPYVRPSVKSQYCS